MKLLYILLMAPQGQGGQQNGWYSFLPLLIIIGIIVIGIYSYNKNKNDKNETTSMPNLPPNLTMNKVISVTLIGGIIGLFISSPVISLNARIQKENANGWKVVQIIPAESGNIFLFLFRLLILVITLFLFTFSNGYYVILEREKM